jgi:Putative restriction endonuclease
MDRAAVRRYRAGMLAHSSASRAASSPARSEPLPDINDRLAPPETRIEVLDGKKIVTMPADPEHATKHIEVAAVAKAHVARGYTAAVDMLTRTSKTSDFAPDVSIFPSAPDPRTKGRQLEELAFEVASKQALKVPTDKARKLVARGVRRVFCVLVKQGRLLEWSPAVDGWATVPETSSIHDRCLVRPLPVAALLDAARADDEVAEALLVKRPPAIRRALSESKAEGHVEGKVEGKAEGVRSALFTLLRVRGLSVSDAERAIVEACADAAQLDRWIERAATATSTRAVLAAKPAPPRRASRSKAAGA